VCGGLAASLILACLTTVRVPSNRTYWRTPQFIEKVVGQYGVTTLGNLGNCIEWNVCKTGLLNELRDNPADCHVLHDLSRLAPERSLRALSRFDAVVILERSGLPESRFEFAPGLNRSYGLVREQLARDPEFVLVPRLPDPGLPHLSLYVKASKLARVEQPPRTVFGDRLLSGKISR
jgi:hypothetical protein